MRNPTDGKRARLALAALIFAAAAVAYLPILGNGFTNFDDDEYLTDQPLVRDGLTASAVAAAFRSTAGANWHPLTWVSHMIDVSLWGMKPRGHHATSLLLHAANAALLFWLLATRSGALRRSAFVAALFALHPLHVESVAWAAERKDVLSTLFWFLTLIAWARYTERPSARRYAAALALFAAGLMSKPMLVTLPLSLLLLDFWPLGRVDAARPLASVVRLVREKAPFFALALAASVVTLYAQRAGGSLGTFAQYPAGARVANALVSLFAYLFQTVWPTGLAIFYPHPEGSTPLVQAAFAALGAVGITWLAFRARTSVPAAWFGWCWYVVTLLPVLGLVQAGEQARADRYTYMPLVGIFVAVAWAGTWVASRYTTSQRRNVVGAALTLVLCLACGALTWRQGLYWRDSKTLFRHALDVTERNHIAHINLALALSAAGDSRSAAEHYERALSIRPENPAAHNNLGRILLNDGKLDAAIAHFRAALAFDPGLGEAYGNLGIALAHQGKFAESIEPFTAAVRLLPRSAEVRFNLGTAKAAVGRTKDAAEDFRAAIAIDPSYGPAHSSLAASMFLDGDYAGAWREVALARSYGNEPPASLIQRLSTALPDPAAR